MQSNTLFSLPFEQQIGQFFFIGLPGTDLDQETRELIEEIKPGGIIIFGRNVESPEQLRNLLDGARALSPVEPLCGIDQEGGLASAGPNRSDPDWHLFDVSADAVFTSHQSLITVVRLLLSTS